MCKIVCNSAIITKHKKVSVHDVHVLLPFTRVINSHVSEMPCFEERFTFQPLPVLEKLIKNHLPLLLSRLSCLISRALQSGIVPKAVDRRFV